MTTEEEGFARKNSRTVWCTDHEGAVQVEVDRDVDQFWLSFNKETSVLVMTLDEAKVLAQQIQDVLAREGQ